MGEVAMRGPTAEEILNTAPPQLRMSSKTTQAYLELRRKILTGAYKTDQLIVPRDIQDEYHINNASTQTLLLRLATEGLIKVIPIREKNWPNNASISEYRVADLNTRHRILSTRHGDFVADISQTGAPAYKETLELKIQYADPEIAKLLQLEAGAKVVFHRNLQRRDKDTIIAISDTYLPFWFAEMIPELEKPDSDIYQLMRQLGKNPTWCTETVDIVQASSKERVMFGLSPDDPSALLKILRRSFDDQGTPLDVQFLTDRGDMYRLHYSFPLFPEGIPKAVRERERL
jgi:hypothetical protein